MKILTNKIKSYRVANGMTQKQLAEKVKVSVSIISKIENGKFVPSTILALKIAKFFRVKIELMWDLVDDGNEQNDKEINSIDDKSKEPTI